MPVYYFENTKTKKRYQIVRFDKERDEVILKGPMAEFREPYSKERFVKLGYRLIKEDEPQHA